MTQLSRRQFLGRAGMAAGGSSLGSLLALGLRPEALDAATLPLDWKIGRTDVRSRSASIPMPSSPSSIMQPALPVSGVERPITGSSPTSTEQEKGASAAPKCALAVAGISRASPCLRRSARTSCSLLISRPRRSISRRWSRTSTEREPHRTPTCDTRHGPTANLTQ